MLVTLSTFALALILLFAHTLIPNIVYELSRFIVYTIAGRFWPNGLPRGLVGRQASPFLLKGR